MDASSTLPDQVLGLVLLILTLSHLLTYPLVPLRSPTMPSGTTHTFCLYRYLAARAGVEVLVEVMDALR